MTAIETAIIIFCLTGVIGFLGKKMIDAMLLKCREHTKEHEYIRVFRDSQVLQREEHEMLMTNTSLLIESNISQIASCLLKQHKEYIKKGKITANECKTWQRMYKSYFAMGGNGFISKLNNEVEELEIEVN